MAKKKREEKISLTHVPSDHILDAFELNQELRKRWIYAKEVILETSELSFKNGVTVQSIKNDIHKACPNYYVIKWIEGGTIYFSDPITSLDMLVKKLRLRI